MTNQERKLISAESVTEGHPDKVCDQISDEILDELLRQDPQSHVAVETSAATGVFLVFGEVTSKGYVDVQSTVRETLRRIGYTSSEVGLDADSCGVIVAITGQSAEINQGVARLTGEKETEASREERYEAQGAGDQGVMFGYATDETDVLMPLPIYLAHRLAFRLTEVRKSRAKCRTCARRQDPCDHRIRRERQAVARRHRADLHAARPGGEPGMAGRPAQGACHRPGAGRGARRRRQA